MKAINIGSRASPLALKQAEMVRDKILCHDADIEVRIIPFTTSGDKAIDKPLVDIGGKGLFARELDQALANLEIDIAVHSAKDLDSFLPDHLMIGATLMREDIEDVLITKDKALGIMDLPYNALIGTASVRRKALIHHIRPDIRFCLLRGNIETRLRKLREGVCDATLLAFVALKRMGLQDSTNYKKLPIDQFLPPAGQGTIVISHLRDQRQSLHDLMKAINHVPSHIALQCERSFLKTLNGNCDTPIGAYASIENQKIIFHGMMVDEDLNTPFSITHQGTMSQADSIGFEAANSLQHKIRLGKNQAREITSSIFTK